MANNVSDNRRFLANAIGKTQYIRTDEIREILKNLEFDLKNKSAAELRGDLSSAVRNNNLEAIKLVLECEHDKYYKYQVHFEYDYEELIEKIEELIDEGNVLEEGEEEYYHQLIMNPIVYYYYDDDDITAVDLKFSNTVGTRADTADTIKFPIIVSFYIDEGIMLIKHGALPEDYVRKGVYISKINQVRSWISRFITPGYSEINCFEIFERINQDIENEPELIDDRVTKYSVKMDDAFGGRINLRATDEDCLPILSQLIELAEAFNNEDDKNSLIEFVENIEEDAFIIQRGLKWHVPNGSLKPIEYIDVIRRVYDVDGEGNLLPLFIQHHIHSEAINRERTDHVIRFIAQYL
ncbi:hypothetical protein EZV73_22765 [Acidaminobacter sp. JC074]|uniref:hypothetical protein n=1 Tax=Acidaminobacter sp. JC074 TaxID=2530199 RepID=UPI001F0FF9D7|nr:hypothetical protein [Acidaminobacter sp. JC074]MCH4890423.1 hypothetical protein [Acidaminobacter sp. JC074]